MIRNNRLGSFRISPSALRAVFIRDRDSVQSGRLPPSLFNWDFGGLVRTQVLGSTAKHEELERWADACLDLEIEPVLVLAKGDEILTEEDVENLEGVGIEMLYVWSPDHPEESQEQNPEDDEWTIERLLALPDAGVVEAYYSTATSRPVSAWPLQSDLRFWIQYGEAVTQWARSSSFRSAECGDLYYKNWPSNRSYAIPVSEVHPVDDREVLADVYSDRDPASCPQQAVSVRRLPFVYDLNCNGVWQSFGRLPGLEMQLPHAQAKEPVELTNSLEFIRNWLGLGRLITESAMKYAEASTLSAAPVFLELVVLKSNHPSFLVSEETVGMLSVAGAKWSFSFPQVPLLPREQAASLRLEGFIGKDTGAPPTMKITLQAIADGDYPFGCIEFCAAVNDYQPAEDENLRPLITLSLDGLQILCAVKPN
jgi:hypothetical protein